MVYAAANRSRARITVIADQGLPVGVATLRSFRMRAISRADMEQIVALIDARDQRAKALPLAKY
jgi:hypothetical protein